MNHRPMIFLSVMASLAVLLVGLWWTILHLTAFSMVDRIVGMMVVTAGWYVATLLAVRWLASWRERRERAFPCAGGPADGDRGRQVRGVRLR